MGSSNALQLQIDNFLFWSFSVLDKIVVHLVTQCLHGFCYERGEKEVAAQIHKHVGGEMKSCCSLFFRLS